MSKDHPAVAAHAAWHEARTAFYARQHDRRTRHTMNEFEGEIARCTNYDDLAHACSRATLFAYFQVRPEPLSAERHDRRVVHDAKRRRAAVYRRWGASKADAEHFAAAVADEDARAEASRLGDYWGSWLDERYRPQQPAAPRPLEHEILEYLIGLRTGWATAGQVARAIHRRPAHVRRALKNLVKKSKVRDIGGPKEHRYVRR